MTSVHDSHKHFCDPDAKGLKHGSCAAGCHAYGMAHADMERAVSKYVTCTPHIPIYFLPFVCDQPGEYCLTGNLAYSKTIRCPALKPTEKNCAIHVTAPDVTIFGHGYLITLEDDDAVGICADCTHSFTVDTLNIAGENAADPGQRVGIDVKMSDAVPAWESKRANVLVQNVQINNCQTGITLADFRSASVLNHNITLRHLRVQNCTVGITTGTSLNSPRYNFILEHSQISGATFGVELRDIRSSRISHNLFTFNTDSALRLQDVACVQVDHNQFSQNAIAINMFLGALTRNLFLKNQFICNSNAILPVPASSPDANLNVFLDNLEV